MKVKELFEPYLAYLKQLGRSDKTISEHRRMLYGSLSHSIQDHDVTSLTVIDAAKVIEAGTAHGVFGPQRSIVVLRQLMKYVHDSGKPTPFDWRDVKVPTVPRKKVEYLTPEEIDKLVEAIDISTLAGLRTRASLELLFASGMRIGELCGLDKEHIDFEKLQADITNSKTKAEQTVYFTPRAAEWVQRYLAARKDNHPYLFVSGRGRLLPVSSRNYIRTHLWNTLSRKRIYHHLFRKSFATRLIRDGADIATVRNLARHKSSRTTLDFYLAVDDEHSKDIHQAIMGNAFNGGVPKKPMPTFKPLPGRVTVDEILEGNRA